MVAPIALIEFVGFENTVLLATTEWALKPIGPPPFEECVTALLFSAVLIQKSPQAQTFLELDFVLGHNRTSHRLKTSVVSLVGEQT